MKWLAGPTYVVTTFTVSGVFSQKKLSVYWELYFS